MATRVLSVLVIVLTAMVGVLLTGSVDESLPSGSLAQGEPAGATIARSPSQPDANTAPKAERFAIEVPIASLALEAPVPEPPQEAPQALDPLDGLVDFYLGDGVMERQLVIDQRLRELTQEPFADLWARGLAYRVDELGSSPYTDADGRPRPCEVRIDEKGTKTMVVLLEAEHPEAWILMQAKLDIIKEMNELRKVAFSPPKIKYR